MQTQDPAGLDASLDLRDATPADEPALAALYRGSRADLALLGDGPQVDALIALQQRIHADGQRRHYPAARHLLLHERGRCIAQLVLEAGAQHLHLIDIAVLPEARRQGHARALLYWARQQALAAGLPLTLQVRRDNLPARTLYLAAGFTVTGADELFEQMQWTGA